MMIIEMQSHTIILTAFGLYAQATEWEQVEGKNTKTAYQAWKPQDTVRFKPSYNTIVPSTFISSTLNFLQLISSGC